MITVMMPIPENSRESKTTRERRGGREDVVGTGMNKILSISTAYTRNKRTTKVTVVTMMKIGTTCRRRNRRTRTKM